MHVKNSYGATQVCPKLINEPQVYKKGVKPEDHNKRISGVEKAIQELPKGASREDFQKLFEDAVLLPKTHHNLQKDTWLINDDIYVEYSISVDDIINGCVNVYGMIYRIDYPETLEDILNYKKESL